MQVWEPFKLLSFVEQVPAQVHGVSYFPQPDHSKVKALVKPKYQQEIDSHLILFYVICHDELHHLFVIFIYRTNRIHE